MKFWFETITAVAMTALAVWQWTQLKKHPRDLALWPLAVGVTVLATLLVLAIDLPPLQIIHEYSRVASNGAWAFLFFCYSTFFSLARMSDERVDRRRMYTKVIAELLLWIAVVVVSYLALYTVESAFWRIDTVERYASLRNWLFYITTDGHSFLLWLFGTIRGIIYLGFLRSKWARIAIVGVITATGLMTFGVNVISLLRQSLYLIYPGSKWPVLRDLYNTGRLSGQILLALSLALAPMMAWGVHLRSRAQRKIRTRYACQIEPLWTVLTDEFPEVKLPGTRGASGGLDLDRLMIEVSDGLAYLARWGQAADGTKPDDAASQIASAIEAKRAAFGNDNAHPQLDPDDFPQWEPDFEQDDWSDRAQWMAELSRNVEQRLTAAAATASERVEQ